jgi:hypothetical protein
MRLVTANTPLKRLAASAAVLLVAGLGLGVSATAASAAAPSAPASAHTDATFTTPYWHLQCTTWTSGGLSSYTGSATCTGSGFWRVDVSCAFGGNYSSFNQDNLEETKTASAVPSCYWGINSVTVTELYRLS